MMICKADFEDLFPDLFQSEPEPAARRKIVPPGADSIARWEDDGGRPLPVHRRRCAASGRGPRHGYDMPELVRAGAMASLMPAAVAYTNTWNMLSALGGK